MTCRQTSVGVLKFRYTQKSVQLQRHTQPHLHICILLYPYTNAHICKGACREHANTRTSNIHARTTNQMHVPNNTHTRISTHYTHTPPHATAKAQAYATIYAKHAETCMSRICTNLHVQGAPIYPCTNAHALGKYKMRIFFLSIVHITHCILYSVRLYGQR